MKIPANVPESDFYYHYKHDSQKSINNFAYEIMGVGVHTEDHCDPQDANMVIYRPLYDTSSLYKEGKLFWLRPLEMWMGDVTKDGKTFPRFRKIDDEKVIAELTKIREKLYPN